MAQMHAPTYTKLNLYQPFYHLTFKCDLGRKNTCTNVSNGTVTPLGEQLCQIILKSMHKCRKIARTNPDGCMDAQCAHAHTLN